MRLTGGASEASCRLVRFSYIVIKSQFIKTHCPIDRLFPHER